MKCSNHYPAARRYSRRFLAGLWTCVGSLSGCSQAGWEDPGADSDGISVALPAIFQDLRGGADQPYFGDASAELSLPVVAQAEGGTNRTLNFGYPGKAALSGYGSYAGQTEVYRKSLMTDQYGVHAVRTATYRTDDQGNHTNVWFTYMAKDTLGEIYATQIAIWNWIDGDQALRQEQIGAWPLFKELTGTHEFMDRPLGPVPGKFDGDFTRTVMLSTDAISPTSGIRDCTLYFFNNGNEKLRYLAYLHEEFGMVEIIYKWALPNAGDADENFWTSENLSPSILPVDGFSLVRGSLTSPAPEETTTSELGGVWQSRLVEEARQSELTSSGGAPSFVLRLAAEGRHYDAARESYDLVGELDHSTLGTFKMFGRYSEGSRTFNMRSSASYDDVRLSGRFEPNLEADELLRLHLVQVADYDDNDDLNLWEGQAEFVRTSFESSLEPPLPPPVERLP